MMVASMTAKVDGNDVTEVHGCAADSLGSSLCCKPTTRNEAWRRSQQSISCVNNAALSWSKPSAIVRPPKIQWKALQELQTTSTQMLIMKINNIYGHGWIMTTTMMGRTFPRPRLHRTQISYFARIPTRVWTYSVIAVSPIRSLHLWASLSILSLNNPFFQRCSSIASFLIFRLHLLHEP